MTEINRLNRAASLEGGDLIPIWDSSDGATRSVSANVAGEFFSGAAAQIIQPLVDEATQAAESAAESAESAAGSVFGVREVQRRSYAEAGYTLVDGSFELGGTVATTDGVLLYEAEGKAYSWGGALPKVVPAGSTPQTTGGFGAAAWSDRTDSTLRAELAEPSGAGLVGGLPVFVTDTDFAGGASTASANNDAAITAAIAYASATGNFVYWPEVYEVQASIPNFHSVHHVGPGGIKRGSDTFRVRPSDWHSNTLYCATTGNNTNDGLTATAPLSTFQEAFNALKNYGPMLEGTWQVIAAAGTYIINSGSHNHTTPSKNRVVIKGPAVGASPAVPTCIVDGGGNAAQYMHGINCDGISVRVLVQDIKFQNFTEASGNTRIGLLGANGADLYTVNVHTFACSWVGIDAKECEQIRIQGGILDGNNTSAYGFVSDSSHTSFGYGAGGLAGGPLVKRCLSAGVYWSTGSQGHCDFVTFEDNTIGLRCAENSRADTVGNNYKRNIVAKRSETGGWFGTGGAAETFNDGTADANITNLQFRAFSGDSTELVQPGSGSWIRIAYDRAVRTATGTATTTLTTPYTIPAYRLKGDGKSCRVHVMGVITCTAGSVINVVFGGMTVAFIVPGASTGLPFEIDVELFEAQGAGHRANGKLIQGLNQTRMGASGAGFISTADQAISVSCTLANAADTITLHRTDVYFIG